MKILKFEKLESSFKLAREMVKKGTEPWTLILAKEETGAIGRKLGRERDFFWCPKGGLWFSLILPKMKIERVEILNYLAAFLIAEAIFEEFGKKPFLKFPNDVYLNGKKVAGVLTQNLIFGDKIFTILGAGINTNIKEFPQNLKDKATSFFLEFEREIDNEKFLEKILKKLKEVFEYLK